MASSDAPVSVGMVALIVRDLEQTRDFYHRALGLEILTQDGETARLGAGDTPLLELRRDTAARHKPNEAGLFHNAFLLPTRSDLGNWVAHAATLGLRLDGASDHLVSEALYLRDPEGNGIEIYWDRPRESWTRNGDQIAMDTLRLDLAALPQSGRWTRMPEGSVIGHVHLQVGNLTQADRFFTGDLGLTRSFSYPTAGWYGSGGYHHHLAGNIWNSNGAGRRSPDAAGLAEIELLTQSASLSGLVSDPFGTVFRLTPT